VYIFQCYSLGIVFIRLGKIIIIVMKPEISRPVNMPERGIVISKLAPGSNGPSGKTK
jgi:hypothetical protein